MTRLLLDQVFSGGQVLAPAHHHQVQVRPPANSAADATILTGLLVLQKQNKSGEIVFIFVHSPALLVSSLFITIVEKPHNLSRPQGRGWERGLVAYSTRGPGFDPGNNQMFFLLGTMWLEDKWNPKSENWHFLAGMGQIARRVLDP